MEAHNPPSGPAAKMHANAVAHGDDIDCYWFYHNQHRRFRVRKALQFENMKTPELSFVICEFVLENGELTVTKLPIEFKEPPLDNDTTLAEVWDRRVIGQKVH